MLDALTIHVITFFLDSTIIIEGKVKFLHSLYLNLYSRYL